MRWIRLLALWMFSCQALAAVPSPDPSFNYGVFGKVTVYGSAHKDPQDFVIFLSGDGGWKKGVVDMARHLADQGAVVAGVDVVHYQKAVAQSKASCTYAASDFENLSKFIQHKLQFKNYREPLLVGYSSGATMVYALLAQAPNNTFRGGLSLGFCNDLTLAKPFCAKNNLSWKVDKKPNIYLFNATDKLEDPWRALNGQDDKVCAAGPTQDFVTSTKQGTLEFLPKVGHGFSAPKNWVPQFIATYKKMAVPPTSLQRDARVQDLPLVEELPTAVTSDFFTILVTGDGGWAGIDRQIARELASQGVPVVGWNSLQYLWNAKDPDVAAKDLHRIMDHYAQRLGKTKVRLVGYSLGADLLPFMVSRLSPEATASIERVVLLGPSLSTSFEFHVSDWIDSSPDDSEKPTLPELQKLSKLPVYCVFGEEEEDSLCRQKGLNVSRIIPMKGGHHFGGDYAAIAKLVLEK